MANSEAPRAGRSRSSSSVVPVVVALLAVGLFLGWLVTRQPEETVAVAEPGRTDAAAADPAAPATVIDPATLNQPDQYVGQTVELESINVISTLGTQMFWVELPGGSPYLVKVDSTAAAQGATAPASGRVNVQGQVQRITPTVLDDWMARGLLRNEDERLQAEFSSTYIQARRVQPAGQ